jgi:predicted membrane-bound spermidine synthase
MIETYPPKAERPPAADLPVPAAAARFLVLLAVFVCAACGLIYELELIALADYLLGDTVTQTSVVLSLMVFAMGIGSLAAKRLKGPASACFGVIEILLALVGGTLAISLYLCFALFGEARPVLIGLALTIGVLIGAEMPLLMTLIQRIRQQDPGRAVADLSAADYVGALLGGLAFPFLLLPMLGEVAAALLTGVINVLAGGIIVLWLFRGDHPPRVRRRLALTSAAAVLTLLASSLLVAPLEGAADRMLAEQLEAPPGTHEGLRNE